MLRRYNLDSESEDEEDDDLDIIKPSTKSSSWQLEDIEKYRYDICDKTDSALQNLIDEIITLYLSTLYRLKFLS